MRKLLIFIFVVTIFSASLFATTRSYSKIVYKQEGVAETLTLRIVKTTYHLAFIDASDTMIVHPPDSIVWHITKDSTVIYHGDGKAKTSYDDNWGAVWRGAVDSIVSPIWMKTIPNNSILLEEVSK